MVLKKKLLLKYCQFLSASEEIEFVDLRALR